MAIAKRASTIALTAQVGNESYLLLNAVDPRWRVGADGKYQGKPALSGGGSTLLPLSALKFIGGLVDQGETPEDAALRELGEEAGARLAEAIKATGGVTSVYTMTRPLEWQPENDVEITYLHAHIKANSLEELRSMIEPHDDCFGIVIVKADQVIKTDKGYVVAGAVSPQNIIFRQAYVPIPYQDWERDSGKPIPQAARDVFDHYNTNGPVNPLVGIDAASLREINVSLYTPKGTDPCAVLDDTKVQQGKGGAVPDGAIFEQLVKPRLKGPIAMRDVAALMAGTDTNIKLAKA